MKVFVSLAKTRGHYQSNTQPMDYRDGVYYAGEAALKGRKATVLRAAPVLHSDPKAMLEHKESFVTSDVLVEFQPVPTDTEEETDGGC